MTDDRLGWEWEWMLMSNRHPWSSLQCRDPTCLRFLLVGYASPSSLAHCREAVVRLSPGSVLCSRPRSLFCVPQFSPLKQSHKAAYCAAPNSCLAVNLPGLYLDSVRVPFIHSSTYCLCGVSPCSSAWGRNSLCRPSWLQRYAYLCLPSTGFKGVCCHCHHRPVIVQFLNFV